MVESLAEIMSHFAGEANRARCLAHIVNLVAKIILRQFDKSKKKKKKNNEPQLPNDTNDTENNDLEDNELEDLADEHEERVLDKEEKEMDEGNEENEGKDEDDDEDIQRLERDIEIMEKAMEDEIEGASNEVKPVRQVLYKVNFHPILVISPCLRSNP
jgi:hypothetical protein